MATAPKTIKVRCGKCRKGSEIAQPAKDHPKEVIWQCPQPGPDGELCGHANVIELD